MSLGQQSARVGSSSHLLKRVYFDVLFLKAQMYREISKSLENYHSQQDFLGHFLHVYFLTSHQCSSH